MPAPEQHRWADPATGGFPPTTEDVPTQGGSAQSGPIDVSGLLATDDRARMASGLEPNGWYAGPDWDPDRYQLLGPGLAGGEGDIWRARYRGDLTSPLPVAVKRLRRPANVAEDWPTPADLRRWEDLRALLLIMRIDHMVSVLDVFVGPAPHPVDRADGADASVTPYVVMEWVPGPTLADEFGGVPATAESLDARLRQVEHVATALEALHSRTVSAGNPSLHRDVKPANCILDPIRGVVLVDVGTMRRMDDGRDLSGRHTPVYTAPEVLADPLAARAPASDRYSLGALAWFCVTGENPPHARDPLAPDRARARAVAEHAGVPDPDAFAAHLTRMLDHDPAARPTDARAWAAQLRTLALPRARFSKTLLAATILIPLVAITLILLPLAMRRGEPDSVGTGGGLSGAVLPSSTAGRSSPPPNRDGQFGPPGPPPDGQGPRPSPDPWPEGAVVSKVAAFAQPMNGSTIGRCPQVSGTADLPKGRTLLFAVENLSVGDQVRHITPIPGWRHPASLDRWRLRVPVGMPSDPLKERYRLELLVVPLAELKGQMAARGGIGIPADSYVGASVFVSRGGQSDEGCPEPPTGPPPG
jgi:serine/threonine-protein kinase